MKKLIFVLIAAFGMSCTSYAQMTEKELKKATKEAQKTIKEATEIMDNPDVPDKRQAKRLVDQAVKNPLLIDWYETWYQAACVYEHYYNQESIKSYNKGVTYDTIAMYDYLDKMITYALRADSLEQIPNAKGKVTNNTRNRLFESIVYRNLSTMINAGAHYFMRADDPVKAYQLFDKYYTIAERPDFEEFRNSDAMWIQYGVKYTYFPALAAFQTQNWENCLKYSQKAQADEEYGEDATEFICECYGELGDSAKWLEALKAGLIKYPTKDYYYSKLLNYYNSKNDIAGMESFVKEMIEVDPDKSYNYYVLGYIAQQNKEYDKAIEQYKLAIEKDNNLGDAYNNLGLCILSKANEYMEANGKVDYRTAAYKKVQQRYEEYLKEALPYFEQLRKIEPESVAKWGISLQQIYYLLKMKEVDEIDAILKEKGFI